MARIYRFPYAQARIGVIPEIRAMRRHRRAGKLRALPRGRGDPARAIGQAMSVSAVAALVCHRSNQAGAITVEWTYWDTTGQARQAGPN